MIPCPSSKEAIKSSKDKTHVTTYSLNLKSMKIRLHMVFHSASPLDCAVSASRTRTLDCAHDPSTPVFHEVWEIPERVTVGKHVPTAGTVAVVVQPRTEDKVCGGTEE